MEHFQRAYGEHPGLAMPIPSRNLYFDVQTMPSVPFNIPGRAGPYFGAQLGPGVSRMPISTQPYIGGQFGPGVFTMSQVQPQPGFNMRVTDLYLQRLQAELHKTYLELRRSQINPTHDVEMTLAPSGIANSDYYYTATSMDDSSPAIGSTPTNVPSNTPFIRDLSTVDSDTPDNWLSLSPPVQNVNNNNVGVFGIPMSIQSNPTHMEPDRGNVRSFILNHLPSSNLPDLSHNGVDQLRSDQMARQETMIEFGGRRIPASVVEFTPVPSIDDPVTVPPPSRVSDPRRGEFTVVVHTIRDSHSYIEIFVTKGLVALFSHEGEVPDIQSGELLQVRIRDGRIVVRERNSLLRNLLHNGFGYNLCTCSRCQTSSDSDDESDTEDGSVDDMDTEGGNDIEAEEASQVNNQAADEGNDDNMEENIDNLTYEDLLAMQEQIGYVDVGVPTDVLKTSLKRERFSAAAASSSSGTNGQCSICWEDLKVGQYLGVVNCAHRFHFRCIKQWLRKKNSCPLCRGTALNIEN